MIGVDDRRRRLRVDDRTRRCRHRHRPPAARIGRDQALRVGDHFERAIHTRCGHRQRRVHRPRHLAVRAGEVGGDRVAAFADRQPDREGLVGLGTRRQHPVAVEDVLKARLAIGQQTQRRPHHRFGIVEHLVHDLQQLVGAVFLRQRLEARRTAPVRRDLRAQVALPLGGGAHIGEDDPLDIGVGPAVSVEPHRRQSQTLAIDFGHRPITARRGAADVGPVGAHAAKAQEPVAKERGGDDIDVGQVRAAVIGVVVDEHVAGLDRRDGRRSPRAPHRASSPDGSADPDLAPPCCRRRRRSRRNSRRQP